MILAVNTTNMDNKCVERAEEILNYSGFAQYMEDAYLPNSVTYLITGKIDLMLSAHVDSFKEATLELAGEGFVFSVVNSLEDLRCIHSNSF